MRTGKAVVLCMLAVLVLIGSFPVVGIHAGQSSTRSMVDSDCQPVDNRVCKLAVEIQTSAERGAGTDNAVYFDIGPLSWRLNNPHRNDFESGHTDEFDLKLHDKPAFTTDDILWLRLQKKGLFGFNGTRDGLDGAWHPKQIVLIVNGLRRHPVEIGEPLNSRCWFWRTRETMDPDSLYSSASNFARTLRLEPQAELTPGAKFSGFIFTPFKKIGISGWLTPPETRECVNAKRRKNLPSQPYRVCATGKVMASAKSTDGLATIDLDVSTIEFCSEGRCDNPAPTDRKRYLRVEYDHNGNDIPAKGEDVRICGQLRWDTDKEGWWEIHPRNCEDITFSYPTPVKCRRPESR